MRRAIALGSLSVVAVLVFAACVVPASGWTPIPASAVVVPADARALRYGASAPEVLDNPALRDKVRGLFGADWASGPGRGYGAPAFFPASSPIRMVRMNGQEYIAITGCVAEACESHRGLLLIGPEDEWKLPVALAVCVLLSSYVIRIQTMWRQAPITAAIVIAAGLTHHSHMSAAEHGLHKVAEVILGCVIGLLVTWVMSKVWPVPEPKHPVPAAKA